MAKKSHPHRHPASHATSSAAPRAAEHAVSRAEPRATGRRQTPQSRLPLPLLIAGVVLLGVIAFAAIALSQGVLSQGTLAPTAVTATPQALPAEISPTDAAAKRDAGAFLLDVREPSEWASFHVPGATLIPLGQLPARLSEVPKGKDVVVMCRTGVRSAQGRDILLKAGYPRVTSLAGGLTAWRAQGLPTVAGE